MAELVRSATALRRGIENTPNAHQTDNLIRLQTTLLEPTRELLRVPMHISSGFRCPELNGLVGGAENSAHLDGRAADFEPIGLTLQVAFDRIRSSSLPFDQLIIECNTWIHIAVAAGAAPPRRQCLVATGSPGNWHYVPAPGIVR